MEGTLLDNRIFAGLALFHARYNDMQIPGIGRLHRRRRGVISAVMTTNAGKARIQGVEFEGNARVFGNPGGPRLNFGWSLGYLDAKFKKFIDARGIDVADRREIQNTPKWTASGTLSYATPLYEGHLNLSSTLSYRSKSQQFEIRTPLLDQEGFSLLDASAVYELPGGHWTVGLHGKNLTDTRYITAGYNFLAQNPDTGDFLKTAGRRIHPDPWPRGCPDRLLRQSAAALVHRRL